MPDTDAELISKLVDRTRRDKLNWLTTAVPDQYATAFGGKWTVVVDRGIPPQPSSDLYWVTLQNAEGQELLRITSNQDGRVPELFELARRNALRVDQALLEVIRDLDDDIPRRQ